MSYEFVEALQLGKSLRENADYYGDFDKEGANGMMEAAVKFFKISKNVLKLK